MLKRLAVLAAVCVVLTLTNYASAHAGHPEVGSSFSAGVSHPIFGLDHLLAMVAVGLLAVRAMKRQAMWAYPAAFVGMMLLGGLLALAGMPMPGAEWAISLSVIVIGLAVALLPKAPLPLVATILGLFALAHGHAHVAEMSGGSAATYMLGFALGTAALHATGIAAGLLLTRLAGTPALRVAGGAIAVCFAVMLIVGF